MLTFSKKLSFAAVGFLPFLAGTVSQHMPEICQRS